VIIQDPEILSEPVFRGTRVPFQTLPDYLEGGETLDEFLEQYPDESREDAIAALERMSSSTSQCPGVLPDIRTTVGLGRPRRTRCGWGV